MSHCPACDAEVPPAHDGVPQCPVCHNPLIPVAEPPSDPPAKDPRAPGALGLSARVTLGLIGAAFALAGGTLAAFSGNSGEAWLGAFLVALGAGSFSAGRLYWIAGGTALAGAVLVAFRLLAPAAALAVGAFVCTIPALLRRRAVSK